MNIAIRQPWTQERFFAWAQVQDIRYEFDGTQPVAMTGGHARHSAICINLQTALRSKLRGTGCRPFGPDAGLQTVGTAVRYPDALVTCSEFDLGDYTVPGVVIVFEVLSPTSGRIDRIVKLREYAAVLSIRRYVILESASPDLTVMERSGPDDPWRVTALTGGDILGLPEIGIEIPVNELYEDITFPEEPQSEA